MRNSDDWKEIHDMYIELMELGATQEDIIELIKIAFEAADRAISRSQEEV
jgi:hypothetical protein